MSVSIYEAKTHLSRLIAELEAGGGELVITRHDVPVAKLVPFRPHAARRRLGGWGPVAIHEDFDTLPPDLASAFGGEQP